MLRIYLTSLCLIFVLVSFGQKTEYSLSLNSGLFSFTGPSAEKVSFINHRERPYKSGYTNNPYGAKNGLCYGLSYNLKRITTINFVMALDFGYELLRSKVAVRSVNGYRDTIPFNENAKGRTYLNYHFINLSPQFGWRINSKMISFDIMAGMDLNYCLNSNETGKATTDNGTKFKTSVNRRTIYTDFRPRFQIAINRNRTGVYLGYSHGLANYRSGYIGGINLCYARLFRFGLSYQLN